MDITDEQKKQVALWIEEGVSLPDVQNRLQEEFKINMTFMEVRFLVDDLDLDLKEESPAAEPEPAPAESQASMPPPSDSGEPVPFSEPEPTAAPASPNDAIPGNVDVSVDPITRPGAVVSGNVVFSDGVTSGWQLDQMGRLGLIPSQEGYSPSPEDIEAFQSALQIELQKKGFG